MAKKRNQLLDLMDGAVEATGQKGRRCNITFKDFFGQYPPSANYIWGTHTHALANELQMASDAVERGECYYAVVSMHPRAGKSDLCSRRFPAYHLCRNPEHEVIFATYNAEQAEYIARDTRRCFERAGPRWGLKFAHDQNQIAAWGLEGHKGAMYAIGLDGGAAGKGANILIIDDYYKNRGAAESDTIRKSVWECFRADLMTRLAPAHAVIVVATRWHENDLVNSIFEEMKNEPTFPKFKLVNFPAENEDGSFLFPERFSREWYLARKASVGSYNWQSLYQGDPRPRTGHLLRADLVQYVDGFPADLTLYRGWDLASTEAERLGDDPDYTVGTAAGYDGKLLWYVDVVRGRWSAPSRDDRILNTALRDGPRVHQRFEVVAGYKDTYTRMRHLLSGKSVVRPVSVRGGGDKVARASVLEAVFESGNVRVVKAPWNEEWRKEHLSFPKGHDDQVDSGVIAIGDVVNTRGRMKLSS
jgi:predicted phage terminase large subunit-like protein